MAARTFLELVQAAANELGIPEPSQIVGGADDTSKQLLALANREGKEFSQLANRNGGWEDLHKEYTFNVVGYSGETGDTTINSPVVTNISSTANMLAGQILGGNGIPNQSRIVTVDSATQVTIDLNATLTATGIDLTNGKDYYNLPSDLEFFMQKTFWDRSYRWQLLGPMEAQEKNVIKYGISPVGPRRRFWIQKSTVTGNLAMFINPVPAVTTDLIAYDYLSNAWCTDTTGLINQSLWAADTDTYKLDEECFILGLKFRYLRAKGLDYAEEFDMYTKACNRVMARDGANRDLPTNAQATGIYLLSSANIPDTGFGS